MDAEILDAVASVDIDPSQATEWFDLVNAAYSVANDDWDTFSEQLSSSAGGTFGTAAMEFLQYAGDHGKTELVGKLVVELSNLPSAYASLKAPAAEQSAQPSGSLWESVVAQFGSGWAGWDGSEAGWTQFRDWTYTAANTQSQEMYTAAYEKLNPLNELALAERIGKLTELGFAVTASAQPAIPDESAAAVDAAELSKIVDEALAEALKEIPGAEELTPEEVAEIRAEIAAELASEDDDE